MLNYDERGFAANMVCVTT